MMTRMSAVFAGASAAVMVVALLGAVGPARAAPPTVVPSPGYDARLQEQRARMAPSRAIVAPVPLHGPRKRAHRHHD
jgi:hypothetical protein